MTWKQRHALRRFLRSSLWPIPLACMVVALVASRWMFWLDRQLGWEMGISVDAARNVITTLEGSLLAFIVFIFSFLLVAVQLASAQFSPRVIARIFRDPFTKIALGAFVFSYTFSLGVLARLEEPVPLLTGILCGYGTLACLAVFLFLIDRLGKELRPVRILASVAAEGRRVIQTIYPQLVTASRLQPVGEQAPLGMPTRVVVHRGQSGVLLAFDEEGLLKLAQQADCVIELVPQVGDFIATDDPLFRIYAGGQAISEDSLRQSVAVGPERTLEQDPAFAFRVIVDIGAKALSPAINDPTTAVLAIDQIHHLLRQVGSRQLDTGRECDASGKLRLVYQTPDWEDFVRLAVTEIRHFGGASIQVARRLRAMLESLIRALPAERAVLLRQELSLLHRSAERFFVEPEDRSLAAVSDSQGMGGTSPNGQTALESKEAAPP
jgi:uncharacterized membrane protein